MRCKNCNREFVKTSGKQQFCSIPCHSKYYYRTVAKPKQEGTYIQAREKNPNYNRPTVPEQFRRLKEYEERVNRIKKQLKVGQHIKFKLPNILGHHFLEEKNKVCEGTIQQITDALITVKTSTRTYSIMWADIYTKTTKIQLKKENVA